MAFLSIVNKLLMPVMGNKKDWNMDIQNFKIVFQPIFHTTADTIIGVEGIPCWRYENDEFRKEELFKQAEQENCLHDFTIHYLNCVFQEIENLRKQSNLNPQIFIYLPQNFLCSPNVAEDVISIIDKTNIPISLIHFEISEQWKNRNQEIFMKNIFHLKSIGINFCINDFGLGYSTLTKLNQIKPAYINIAKIVAELDNDKTGLEIVRVINELAQTLKIKVMAKGIENKDQYLQLQQAGCVYFQGSYFSEDYSLKELALRMKIESDKNAYRKKDRRKFFRINLNYPLEAKMGINYMKEKMIQIGFTKVLIYNLGPGGLGYLSKLNIPIRDDVHLIFRTSILGEDVLIKGNIVWKQKRKDQLFEYGVEFDLEDKEREEITSLLNRLQIQLKNNDFPKQTNIFNGSYVTFFKKS
jgi:EAL domain-containing protein (putative c-di-GMP-specific phosphodiesterase class I)